MKDDSDSDKEGSSSEGEDMAIPYLFQSSLDVGSHFIDCIPENELVFVNNGGQLFTAF